MALESLLYVSESRMAANDAEPVLDRILETANAHNPAVGITGALLFTGTHFAQVLEGEEAVLTELMAAIAVDPSHGEVNIILRGPLTERRFPDWSMAYNGASDFVSHQVTRVLNAPSPWESSRAADWLSELIEQFSGFRGTVARRWKQGLPPTTPR